MRVDYRIMPCALRSWSGYRRSERRQTFASSVQGWQGAPRARQPFQRSACQGKGRVDLSNVERMQLAGVILQCPDRVHRRAFTPTPHFCVRLREPGPTIRDAARPLSYQPRRGSGVQSDRHSPDSRPRVVRRRQPGRLLNGEGIDQPEDPAEETHSGCEPATACGHWLSPSLASPASTSRAIMRRSSTGQP